MGVDKARVPLRGQPMAMAVAQVIAEVCDRVMLVRRHPDDGLPWPGAEVVWDDAGADDALPHPLYGVARALSVARGSRALVVACDVPGLTASAVGALVNGAGRGGAVAFDGERRHPLVAVFPSDWAARAAEMAICGGSVRAFAQGCPSVLLPPETLVNLNHWTGTTPLSRLLVGLRWLDEAERERVRAGEIVRQAARGMVDPNIGSRYADPPGGSE